MLEARATGKVGIRDVGFWRLDAVNERFVPIAVDTTAPYRATVDIGTFALEWNQLIAVATDNNGNRTAVYIWIDREIAVYLPQVRY